MICERRQQRLQVTGTYDGIGVEGNQELSIAAGNKSIVRSGKTEIRSIVFITESGILSEQREQFFFDWVIGTVFRQRHGVVRRVLREGCRQAVSDHFQGM